MKKEYWNQLEAMLKGHGFLRDPSQQQDLSIGWFVCAAPDTDVTTYLRFVFKPKLRTLSAHLGWRHDLTHHFCLTALKADWPRGFSWLSEAGVLGAPCLTLFNLADHMGWSLAGMPIGEPRSVYESAQMRLGDAIAGSGWMSTDARALLVRYVEDEKPFTWRSSNSAIRLAQVAGLCASMGSGSEAFEQCAAAHSALIEADMFSLGSAESWIAALRARLASQST